MGGASDGHADYWLTRNRYREKFGLSAEDMDNEDIREVLIHQYIWRIESKKQDLEQKRSQQ